MVTFLDNATLLDVLLDDNDDDTPVIVPVDLPLPVDNLDFSDNNLDLNKDPFDVDDVDSVYWLSQEQMEEMFSSSNDITGVTYPMADSWDTCDFQNVTITVDKGRIESWKQAKNEFNFVLSKIPDDSDWFHFTTKLLFSPTSRLPALIQNAASVDYRTCLLFLASFFSACQLGIPYSRLISNKRIDVTGLLDAGTYNMIWKKISTIGAEDDTTPIWLEFQDALNSDLRFLFIDGYRSSNIRSFLVALDDDKVHLASSGLSEFYGLKRAQHVKANRKGVVLNTAVMPASGFPLSIKAELKGETSVSCYIWMVKKMFGQRTGDGDPDLSNIRFASDRGYWKPSLLFEFLLPCGADILGTVARCFWYPFTFTDKKESTSNDKHGREQIPVDGFKNTWYKKLEWGGRWLQAVCYRPGTGKAVSLSMSTIHEGRHFDFNLVSPSHHKWYFDPRVSELDRQKKAFKPLFECSTTYQDLLLSSPVKPRTLGQTCNFWFTDRPFSLTSSTTENMARVRAQSINPGHPKRQAYEKVFKYAGIDDLLPTDEELMGDDEDETSTVQGQGDEDEPDSDGPVNLVAAEAKRIINCLKAGGEGRDEIITFFQNENFEMELDVCRFLLNSLVGGSKIASRSHESMKKEICKWATQCPECAYEFYFMTTPNLKKELEKLKQRRNLKFAIPSTKADRLLKLGELSKQFNLNSGNDGGDTTSNTLCDPLLQKVFERSFMKKLAGESKVYAAEGHANEEPLLKKLLRDSEAGTTGNVSIEALFNAPLVGSSTRPFFKDSADAIGIAKEGNGEPYKLAIEIKSRVTVNTFIDARDNVLAIRGYEAFNLGEPCYAHIDGSSGEVPLWIPKSQESFQLLHHVTMYDAEKGLLLVGNKKDVIFGLFVKYPNDLKEAYLEVIDDLYEAGIAWAWGPIDEIPVDQVKAVLISDGMKNRKMSYDSFLSSFEVWRKLNVDVDPGFRLPVPPCSRLLPYTHSSWNNWKGGSDTLTHLMWLCLSQIPHVNPQTAVIGRLFQIYAVIFHRMRQVGTVKGDLNKFPSLHHFRNAASKRAPFHDSLESLTDWLCKSARALEKDDGLVTPPRSPQRTELPRPAQTPGRAYNTRSAMSPVYERTNLLGTTRTGDTPRRGVAKSKRVSDSDSERLTACCGFPCVRRKVKDGNIVPASNNRCCICDKQTDIYCLGCKRYYCMNKDRNTEIISLVEERKRQLLEEQENTTKVTKCQYKYKNIDFLKENPPKPYLKCKVYNKKGDIEESFYLNSCYQIKHRTAFENLIEDDR